MRWRNKGYVIFLSAAEGQRPRNYLSCCSWIFAFDLWYINSHHLATSKIEKFHSISLQSITIYFSIYHSNYNYMIHFFFTLSIILSFYHSMYLSLSLPIHLSITISICQSINWCSNAADPGAGIGLVMELFSRMRWRLISAQLSNNFGYSPWCTVSIVVLFS